MNKKEKKEMLNKVRRTYRDGGCKKLVIEHENGRKSAITNQRIIGIVMDVLNTELGLMLDMPQAKTPDGPFVILNPEGEFFRDFCMVEPKVGNSFNADYASAKKYGSYEKAVKAREKICEVLKEGDGAPLPMRLFRIAEFIYSVVG